MEKILICNTHPFGKLTDAYKWCQYLKDKYDVTLICFENDENRTMDGVTIKRVSYRGNKNIRGLRFILTCIWNILFFKGRVFIVHFDHCDLIKRALPWKKMHIDVRTVCVWGDQAYRDKYDANLSAICKRFDTISVISEGVKDRLQLPNAWILPLGADVISSALKNYDKLRLIYVGTFDYRRLDDTIEGFRMFIEKHPDADIHYDMIGGCHHGEVDDCRKLVAKHHLDRYITIHGRVENHLLRPYFDACNIGVCYVPKTPAYNIQPPTKTFEYVLSGLYCIATSTDENCKVVTPDNGVLIEDNAESFCQALDWLHEHKVTIQEQKVRDSLKDYLWSSIVNYIMIPNL